MSITRDVKETINTGVKRDPEFATALLDEAVSLFLNGEPDIAKLILRDLVNATIGFEELALQTSLPSKSLHRMLSAKGNPTMNNLTAILTVLRQQLNPHPAAPQVKYTRNTSWGLGALLRSS